MKLKLLLATLLYTSISFAQVPNYVPTNGLVGWWPFNGNANDISGNNNNGTVIGGATLVTDHLGNPSSAYEFDGIDDQINVSHENSLLFGNNEISISVWIYIEQFPSNNKGQKFIAKQTNAGSDQNGFHINVTDYANDERLLYRYKGGPSLPQTTTFLELADLPIGTFFHLVAVTNMTENTDKLYINGDLLASNTPVTSIGGMNTSDLIFGWAVSSAQTEPFNGVLDDIGIYNRPLTECEIQDLYHAQLNSSTVDAGIDQTICSGESVTLTASNSMNYSWNNNVVDGSPFTPNATSSYVVMADTAGCTSTDSLTVTVNETTTSTNDVTAIDTYTSPSGIVYDVSGIYIDTILNAMQCDSIITINLTVEYTGTNELENTMLSVYPNPTSEVLSISGLEKLNGIYGYKIASISGTVISEIKGQSKHVNVSELIKGIYFLNIMHEEGIETVQFIKQ